MSSDSERQPHSSKRKRLVVSDSDSSEGSTVVRAHRKRRVYKVVSDPETTDDDSDVAKPLRRRKNHRVVSEDEASGDSSGSDGGSGGSSQIVDDSTGSEWQSDWESASDDSEPESIEYKRPSKASKSTKSPKKVSDNGAEASSSNAGGESDASDGQSDKCPICLLPFRQQEVATPSSCEHCFCLCCLMEWSKNINTCPVDRQAFTVIHVRSKLGGKVVRHVPVQVKTNMEETIQEDPTYCEVCHQCDREDRMLLCDGCDLGYHLECLDPPMNEVPMDEWYCPECSRNSQDDAEAVSIDLDEIPDLMAEARGLGVSYGRTRTGIPRDVDAYGPHRMIPRTRQIERVRANIRADRTRAREVPAAVRNFDPDQPSTSSSGMESISENSRSRSPNGNSRNRVRSSAATAALSSRNRAKPTRKKAKKKRKVTTARAGGERMVREVRIVEVNDDGEEEEIITYVNVAPTTTKKGRKSKRSRKKRRGRKSRRARTVSSMAAAISTAKKRLANTLGIVRPNSDVTLSGPTVKVRRIPSERGALNDSRNRAGISQVSLFGNNLGLNYSPPGSDDEFDSATGDGPFVSTHRRSAVSSTRRRFALKAIANPVTRQDDNAQVVDLIGSIINSQELWHSKKNTGVTLKADGTLLIEKKNQENKHSLNNNESPVKKKENVSGDEGTAPTVETPLDLSSVNPSDITQAPMYNSPRGGGNRGNFRGGYRDGSRHSQGGQSYGGRDSYSGGGRHSYGGNGSRDNFGNREFGPPANYNSNFEHRGPPPFGGTPPFRNRNPQHFRPDRQRMPMPDRPMFPPPMEGHDRPPFPHPNHFPRPRIPLCVTGPPPGPPPGLHPNMPSPMSMRPPMIVQEEQQQQQEPGNFHEEFPSNSQENRESFVQQLPPASAPSVPTPERTEDEECDIYCDIEAPNKSDSDPQDESANESSIALLPPPEPPSGLLDFEEDNSKSDKDNDSDQDLVIDDTPKEESSRGLMHDDKYDPFAADSDTNDSDRGKNSEKVEKKSSEVDKAVPIPLDPPPMPPEFPSTMANDRPAQESSNPLLRLTAYDDDDEEDSQDDCPNFSIYSSATMDVARHTEQELSQQIGPLEPPPLPPDMPDDDDVIVGDVQTCDLADIPEPSDPYVESLRKERQTLSRIPPKKISNDSRGKITFKIGNKFKLNNKLSNLYDELDENIEVSIEQEREMEEKRNAPVTIVETTKRDREVEKDDEIFPTEDIKKDKEEKRREKKSTEDAKMESDEEISDKSERTTQADAKAKDDDRQKDSDNNDKKSGGSIRDDVKHSEDEEDDEENRKEKADKEARAVSDVEIDDNEKKKESNKDRSATRETLAMSTIDLTEKSNDTIISIAETVQSSPKKAESQIDANIDRTPERRTPIRDAASDDEKSDDRSDKDESDEKVVKSRKSRKRASRIEGSPEVLSDIEDRSSDNDGEMKDAAKTSYSSSLDQARAGASSSFDVDDETENFPLEKEIIVNDKVSTNVVADRDGWESDGAYTPCKDERPVKEKELRGSLSPFESGLEPITPTKDRSNDDLDGCRTPVGYAGLGTEAISETDEPMNFEDELTLLSLRKEKEMEDGEIMDDGKVTKKHSAKSSEGDDGKRKRKKDKKEKSKETEKNKENISSENQVAWKKISKSTKERQYRDKDKRSRSRERDKDKEKDKEKDKGKPKKKIKEAAKKKEKRKELPRYDVRKIVAEKPARPRKDEYGRDIREQSRSKSRSKSAASRHRTVSRERRSRSYSRIRSRSRSRSRVRRSWSRDRRSLSKGRRSVSRRRSLSRIRRKRTASPRQRSLSKKRSVSRRRSKSPVTRRRRSLSTRRRRRSLSRKHRSRSRDKRKEKPKKHANKSRSRSRNRKRSRTKSPKRTSSKSREKKHPKRKPPSRSRSKHRSLSRDRNRNWNPMNEKPVERERNFSRDKEQRESWSAQWTPSWSRSNSPVVNQHEELPARTWSPPPALDGVAVPPKNLTVILTNKEAIKKKRKEKRKESKKTRGGEPDRRKKTKRTRTPPPSKEVFASGDNILVSVCFNKENEAAATGVPELPETIPLLAAAKRRRREPIQTEPAKKPKKDKAKEKRPKSPKGKKEKKKKSKAAEIAATKKPVAVIDLDQSPFREQTPSPRDVIVLSDDDDKQVQELATPEQHASSQISPQHDQFVSQGPKTPPEPQVKFSISKQSSNLRPSMMNPLLEEEEEEEEIDERVEEELEMRAQEELELRLKIGPNTPPEPPSSPPTSPDAYDPFDPTKSRSPTPTASQEATPNDERDRNQRNNSPRKHDTGDETLTPSEPTQTQDPINQDKQQTEKPKIISMVTIKRASPKRDTSPVVDSQTIETVQILDSPTKVQQNQQNVQSTVNPFATINPVLATVAAAVQRSAIFNTSTPIAGQRNLQQPNRISPSTQIKQRAIDRPQLPNLFANAAKPTPIRMQKTLQNKNMSTLGQNGSDVTLDITNDMVVDMSSPYSPGSSLSDGIFDPPSPGNHNGSPANVSVPNKVGASKNNKATDKKDAFDALFGSSPAMKPANKARTKKAIEKEKRNKKSTNPKVGVRMDENQLQILDDLPSSAVEMQVKDKFLKKLNRQERVVEEVKLVLKPHYTKKHVTKDEYKDIMRKAVPKICHNKTGEINPKKIAQLIEAYVKKCRSSKKKKLPALPVNSTGKTVKPAKNLWS